MPSKLNNTSNCNLIKFKLQLQFKFKENLIKVMDKKFVYIFMEKYKKTLKLFID
jgi:hypothetical protein